MGKEITPETAEQLRETVRGKYAERAVRINVTPEQPSSGGSCCGGSRSGSCCGGNDPVTANLYGTQEAGEVPEAALAASLGCGNPTALARLAAGEVVLDLGSGGGIDVLLSAKRVGPTGFAYGLDMTDEMLALAEQNRAAAGAKNVRFLNGQIEDIPLPDETVDVVISNCVINLAVDKGRVLREAFRVLKPGGRFAVSDVVAQGELPAELRRNLEAWVGCVAGALEEGEYRRLLTDAGFVAADVEVTRVYDPRELAESLGDGCCSWQDSSYAAFDASGGRVVSAFVRATKPLPAKRSGGTPVNNSGRHGQQ